MHTRSSNKCRDWPCYWTEALESRVLLSVPAVGNPNAANGWSTTSAVSVTASSSHVNPRPPIRLIDGSGIEAVNGLLHAGPQNYGNDPGQIMWLSGLSADSASNPNPGTVSGSHWVRFSFDQAYSLGQMWIWNDNEATDSYDYRILGMKNATIQYSLTGGSSPSEWHTIFTGSIPEAAPVTGSPTYYDPVNLSVDFSGASAKYVVITAASGLDRNYSNGQFEQVGLSEVRFNLVQGTTDWRSTQLQTTLTNSTLTAKFQAGLIYQLKDTVTNEVLLSIDPTQINAVQSIFGTASVNLNSATVSQTFSSSQVNAHFQWTNGSVWDINWSLVGGDLVLNTSAQNPLPVSMFSYMLPNSDIASHTLVSIDTNGTAHSMNAPYTGSMFAGSDPQSMPMTAVQPLVALYQGNGAGWFVEGRDLNVGPSNMRAFGKGQIADLQAARGYMHQPSTTPSLYEVRIRTYHGAWQDAVDPYIDWMKTGLGMVPIDQKPQTWIKDIHTQAYVTVTDYTGLNALAARVNPSETFLGRQPEYRYYGFDIGYPDYRVTPAAASWIAQARALGFHVGVHVNVGSIDRSNTTLISQMQAGMLQVGTDSQGNPIWDGTTNNAYVSAAYQPWRQYLINAVAGVISAGADVIYLDQTNGVLGKYFVNGMTGVQGVMLLEQEMLVAYPNIAMETEQFNPMASNRASFALTTVNLGHPLSGYIFSPFIKVVPEGYYYSPIDLPTWDQFANWGHFTPGASTDETWMQITGAFQQYDLVPDSRLPRNANQMSGFSGPNGVTGFFEKTSTTRSFVVYRPGQSALTFGLRYTNITQWSGPGYVKNWLIYNGSTMLGLDPAQTYYFDPGVGLNSTRFHVTAIPPDFAGYSDSNRRIIPQEVGFSDQDFRLFFTGHGTMQAYVPADYDAYIGGQKLSVDPVTHLASFSVNASSPNFAVLRAFKRSSQVISGKWANLQLSWPQHQPGYVEVASSLYPPDGIFEAVSGTGFIFGKLPLSDSIHLKGSYRMRDDAYNSKGDGVIRINGTEVMRVSPGTGAPYSAIPFDVDVTSFAGQYVMLEFVSDGEIHGPDYSDWISPQTVVAPTVIGASYDLSRSPNKLSFSFNMTVGATGALHINNVATGASVTVINYSYNNITNTATFTFNGPIPDGNYRATLTASAVKNAANVPMVSDYTYSFFALAGDANHDRVVDISDLGMLATNWQGSGKTFAEGDFNYDSIVDISDLGILATNWQKSLAAPSQPATAPPRSPVPSRSPTNVPFSSPRLIAERTRHSLVEEVGLSASPLD